MVVAGLRSGVILIGAFLATAVFTGCGGKASLSGGSYDRQHSSGATGVEYVSCRNALDTLARRQPRRRETQPSLHEAPTATT
jgi:hypothetical protein